MRMAVLVLGLVSACTSRQVTSQENVGAGDSIVFRANSGGLAPDFRTETFTLRGDGSVNLVTGDMGHTGPDGNMIMLHRTRRLSVAEARDAFEELRAIGVLQVGDHPPPPDAPIEVVTVAWGDRQLSAAWSPGAELPVVGALRAMRERWFTTATDTLAATIEPGCAPWDGAAVEVTVPIRVEGDSMSLRLSVWRSSTEVVGHRWLLASPSQEGSASLCAPEGSCQVAREGWVEITDSVTGGSAHGRYRVRLEGSRLIEGSFAARWLDRRVLCG